ncbi:hypothetical protein Tco_0431339 [Tanacetum coccineum]
MAGNDDRPPTPPSTSDKLIPFGVTSITNNVPVKLNLEKMNYNSWSSFFKIHLGSIGLKHHIESATPSSSDKDWSRLDDLVKVWILGTCTESLQDQVATTPGTAKDLWNHIKDLFHDNEDAWAINLDNQLHHVSRAVIIARLLVMWTNVVLLSSDWRDMFTAVKRFPRRSPTVDQVLTRVLNLAPSVTVFRAFYTRSYSDGLFSFAKRSTTAPSCFTKPPDSIKNWSDHFFWVDSCAFPISVPLYTGGILEKDFAPLLTARQEETVRLLESHKALFSSIPGVLFMPGGLSKYYPFDDNSYPAYEYSNELDMGLLDFIQTADPRKVRAVEVQKGANQVTLLESTKDCFMPLVIPAAGGSSSPAAAEVLVLTEERQKDVAPEDAYLNLADPDDDVIAVRQGEERVVSE